MSAMFKAVHVSVKGEEVTDLPRARQYSSPEAIALAEAYLVVADLNASLASMKALIKFYPESDGHSEERSIAEALFRDAVVQFAGCFGDRAPLLDKERVAKGDQDDLDAINYLKDLRDSYAAHRFGPLRQCSIAVEAEPHQFTFTYAQLYYSLPVTDILGAYVTLFEAAIAEAQANCVNLEAMVRQQLATMGYANIQKLPMLNFRAPGIDELKVSRSGFREGKKSRQQGRAGPKGQKP